MDTLRATLRSYLKAPEDGKASGFAIVLYETSGGLSPAKMGGPFTPGVKPGDWFIARGTWRENDFRGQKEEIFNAKVIRPDLPETIQGVRELLSRTFDVRRHGIDAKAIARFVERYGSEAARLVERDPMLLMEMTSDRKTYGSAILNDWGRRNSGRRAVSIMELAGLPPRAIDAVLEAHRDDTSAVINSNPYKLARLPEVGFEHADRIGRQLGIPHDDPRRVEAAVIDAVAAKGGEGHTYTPLSDISDALRKFKVEPQALRVLIRTSQNRHDDGDESRIHFDIVDGDAVAQHDRLCEAERAIAISIARLIGRRIDPEQQDHITKVSERVLSWDRFARLDDVQKEAVAQSARERISVLTGGPGTGKSTVTEAIAEIAAATIDGPVILLAPTGKAARRLAEATGRSAQTVHRGLDARLEGGRSSFGHCASNPLPSGCFVIVDEASMLDVETTAALLDALPPDGRLLLVGDRFQLPSVGPGYVLGDLLAARASNGLTIPSSELVNVYRTDRNSSIAKGAVMVKNGEIPFLDNKVRGGLVLFEHKTPLILDRISALVNGPIRRQLGLDPLSDVAILCPQAPGPAGTWEINSRMSRELNPDGAVINGIAHGPNDNSKMPLLRIGDRVMLTKNDPDNDVMNGDVGTLVDVYAAKSGRARRMLKVAFDSGKIVDFPLSRWRDLIPAYAITGHKSQGSQYPLVILPLTTAHSKMLERTLIYTEWTRAQDYLMLVGEREALEMAVDRVTSSRRRTRLRGFLESALDGLDLPAPQLQTQTSTPQRIRPLRRLVRPTAERAPAPSL